MLKSFRLGKVRGADTKRNSHVKKLSATGPGMWDEISSAQVVTVYSFRLG